MNRYSPGEAAAIGAGGDAELGAKGAVEVGDVAEAAIEGDVEDFGGFGGEAQGGFAKAGAEDVLVGRDAGEAMEGAEEMVGAEAGFAGESGQGERSAGGVALYGADGACHSRDGGGRRRG